jgi:C-terminal processing protease CtpA/Prc
VRATILAVFALAAVARAGDERAACVKDVNVALDQIEEQCKHLLRVKKIKWGKVRSECKKLARKAKTLQDHYEVLVRMIARLHDGHAYVRAAKGVDVKWPGPDMKAGPGLFLCRSGKQVLVKSAWGPAKNERVEPGLEVVKIDGEDADDWLEERVETLSDCISFSTDQQAFFFACHWGLGGPAGSKLKLSVKPDGKKARTVTIRRGDASVVPYGPVFPPEGLQRVGRQMYGKTKNGWGYIHLRDTKRELPAQLDQALKAIGEVPGLILDFRANGGGSFDHDATLARFVPAGKELRRAKAYPIPSAGPNPYGGPIVVIVDAGVRSAGETGSGMFKEDGRAYMIGESPTAGMSSSKTTIELPSGKFSLYVSVYSNKSRFQGGRGIEGIGIEPHEIVPYDPEDLANGVDTLIRRAEELLADFPKGKVPYRPKQYGWKPPG